MVTLEMKMHRQEQGILSEMMMISFSELVQMLFRTLGLELQNSISSIVPERRELIFVGKYSKIQMHCLQDIHVIFEQDNFQLGQAVLEPFRC